MSFSRRSLTSAGAAVAAAALLLPLAATAADGQLEHDAAPSRAPAVSPVGPDIIGFESDTAGPKADPFSSVENPTVNFQDSNGDDLSVQDFGNQSNGQGLAAVGDAGDQIIIRFDVPTRRLSVKFGNDDPGFSNPGTTAVLRVYRFGKLVATRSVLANRNDAADQVVTYKGKPVNRATFTYEEGGVPNILWEIVDDIKLAQACTIKGNASANLLVGNDKSQGVCGFDGNDRLLGKGGNDVVKGGPGRDILNGGKGNDLLKGGPDNDTLRTRDGVGGNDVAYGGPGNDTCIIDVGDLTVGCEVVLVP